MRFGGKDVVLTFEGRQQDAREFGTACRAVVATARDDQLSAADLTAAIVRLGASSGFDVQHTGTDTNSINFVVRRRPQPAPG